MAHQKLPTLLQTVYPALQSAWKKELNHVFSAPTVSPSIEKIFRRYLQNPGKCIRPSLFLAGYRLFHRGTPPVHIVRLAISFEMLHVYLLIHDDIMDQSATRRGQPSLHVLFETFHRQRKLHGSAKVYGRNLAILMGDLLISKAEEVWTDAIARRLIDPALRKQFDLVKERVYWGQAFDLDLAASRRPIREIEIIHLMREKSGVYSIYQPLLIGVMAAGNTKPKSFAWIKPFAINLGIAFQIVDDVLGVFGDEHETGKSHWSDIEERKKTLLVFECLRRANSRDRQIVKKFYAYDATISSQTIKQLFEKYDVRTHVMQTAHRYYKKCLSVLHTAPIPALQKSELAEFAAFIVGRRY